MDVQEGVEGVVRLPAELQAVSLHVEAAERVVLARVLVVDPVVLALVEHRRARGDGGAERPADRRLEVGGAAAAVGEAGVAVGVARRPDGVELDHAGRRVAPEQRPLGTAQDLDVVDVPQRHALEDGVLEHDVVDHHRDRLRGVEVEVGVAQAADVEAREGAAEGGLEQQARHPAGERQDVAGAGGERLDLVAAQGRDRQRHELDVLRPLLGRDGDLAEHGRRSRLGLLLLLGRLLVRRLLIGRLLIGRLRFRRWRLRHRGRTGHRRRQKSRARQSSVPTPLAVRSHRPLLRDEFCAAL